MNSPNKDQKPNKKVDNMELLKQQSSSCGAGCACHTSSGAGKSRWIIGVIVLAVAGVMVARAITRSGGSQSAKSTSGFADPVASQTAAGAPNSGVAASITEESLDTTIGSFSELNTVAAKTDAVFIFVPGKDGASDKTPSATIRGAARTIESKAGFRCGLFTLKAGSRDYDQIVAQMSVPGVLALVKGRGMSAVSGEITEAKLVQGFVAASSSGGCGAGGGGCGPATAGCQ